MIFTTINPATEEILENYEEMPASLVKQKLNNANEIFPLWKKSTFKERSNRMFKVADVLRANKQEYAKLMALEMGKPLAQGIGEVEKCAWVCEYYAENSEQFLKDKIVKTDYYKNYIAFQPIGAILAIMPWNFPFWQVFRFAAPNLMAGNVGILKHSPNTFGCSKKIEEAFLEAGFPVGVFTNLIVSVESIPQIIESKHIAAVTLTGSTPAGSSVGTNAGKAIKKVVLELGGSDPYIIFKDANLEKAAELCVAARTLNSGQSCIAAKRFVVEKPVIKEFTNIFVQKMSQKVVGNPLDDKVNIGPQARRDLQQNLNRQVEESVKLGAKIALGGELPSGKGYFYPATVLTDVKKGCPAYDEEVFGPVAAIINAEDEQEAINIANDTKFGLGAAIFSKDIEKAEYIAKNIIQSGTCCVNDFVKSDPRLPFGGTKASGYGRELSEFGIYEFVNIKTIAINK